MNAKRTRRKVLTAQLPPTPCTPEMRDKLVAYAEREGKSIAELQRAAFDLFLSSVDSKAICNDSSIQLTQEQAS